jgi:glycerophosphodiester phosphodiesterase
MLTSAPAEVSIHLVREINKVSEFYDEIYNALTRKAKTRYRGLLLDYSAPVLNPAGLDHCELEHNLVTFVEFRQDLEKLRWFGRVNVDGFRKLLRKLGTRSVGHDPSIKDIAVRLGKLQFATQGQCLVDMEKLDGHIRSLDSVRTRQNSREELFYQRISHISSLLPSAALLYQAIAADDDAVLVDQLDNSREPGSVSSLSATIPFLLQLSIRLKSSSCVSAILARLGRGDSPTDSEVISDGIHNIILELGRAKAARHLPAENPLAKTTFEYTATISLLRFILERLPANHRPVLRLQDSVERLPLHYACEYGLAEVCQILLGYMKMWGQICVGTSESPVLVPDAESHTPLHLAVMGGHVDATAILIESHKKSCDRDDPAHHGHALSFTTTSSELLIIAAKSESSEMVQLLLSTAGADVNHSTDLGETSLYIAARSGNEDLVKLLLDRNAKADMREKDENWTPLITACVYGYLPVAKLLLETKADILHYDRSNWTAIDHASYRGHIPLAKELWEAARNSTANCPPRQLNHPTIPVRGQPRRSISTIKSYVVVNLVSFDAYKPLPDYFNTASYSDHGSLFSLSISALDVMGIESEGPGRTVHLPLLEDTTNAPWIFSTRDPRKSKLVFELFRVTSDKPIGTGIALLDNLKNAMGVTRESLNRNFTIPILSKETMEFTGAVTFNFLVSTPIVLPDTLPIETEHLWHERGPTKVVGHRGDCIKHTLIPSIRLTCAKEEVKTLQNIHTSKSEKTLYRSGSFYCESLSSLLTNT